MYSSAEKLMVHRYAVIPHISAYWEVRMGKDMDKDRKALPI
jgi:hypothetical protein